jgi:hypothetical protein
MCYDTGNGSATRISSFPRLQYRFWDIRSLLPHVPMALSRGQRCCAVELTFHLRVALRLIHNFWSYIFYRLCLPDAVFEYRHVFTFGFIACEYCRIIRWYFSGYTDVAAVPPKFGSHCIRIIDCGNLKRKKDTWPIVTRCCLLRFMKFRQLFDQWLWEAHRSFFVWLNWLLWPKKISLRKLQHTQIFLLSIL